ncbi:hypothetical protein Mgra_00000055 [Meloidogyne graminicola]|uniref:EGF-like domain-containing protein n=1 Tax=Meloidogyne graminicola TaxID=189291 RepID=A0A8T0A305_9BILA|nr:hypothetical protein Mgra_00000055 [Meloidogyne graminicola]
MDLLILCCFGGIPFIQFPFYSKQPFDKIKHQWDPTDWIAIDITDEIPKSLDKCDLWNLTFASNNDKHLFKKNKGKLKCRCPLNYFGNSCQYLNKTINNLNFNLTKIMTTTIYQGNSFVWFLLVFMILAAIMITLFMKDYFLLIKFMFRNCCFCDCFGGLQNNKNYDQPLDPKTVNYCMEAIKKHEKEEKRKYCGNEQWKIALPPPPQQQSLSPLSSSLSISNNPLIIDSLKLYLHLIIIIIIYINILLHLLIVLH